jgi:hypothetical protein
MLGQVARTISSDLRGHADVRLLGENRLSSMTAALFGIIALLAEHSTRSFTHHTR